jgi:hypothetical protein
MTKVITEKLAKEFGVSKPKTKMAEILLLHRKKVISSGQRLLTADEISKLVKGHSYESNN